MNESHITSTRVRPSLTNTEKEELLKLFVSGNPASITEAIKQMQIASASADDKKELFSETTLSQLVENWDLDLFLELSLCLRNEADLQSNFFSVIAKKFCEDDGKAAYQMLEKKFGLPFNRRESLDCDFTQGVGTIVFEAFYRDLLLHNRIRLSVIFDGQGSFAWLAPLTRSFDTETRSHSFCPETEAGPSFDPDSITEGSNAELFEYTFACSEFNFLRDADGYEDYTYLNEEGFSDIAFLKTLLPKRHAVKAPFLFILWAAAPCKLKMFKWTSLGIQFLEKMCNGYLRSRRLIPACDTGFYDGSSLPGFDVESFPAQRYEMEWEARLASKQGGPLSYSLLTNELKWSLFDFLFVLRDEARQTRSKTSISFDSETVEYPVIENLANHLLICIGLHPSTPKQMVQRLKNDSSPFVAERVRRELKYVDASPKEQLKEILTYVVKCVGKAREQAKYEPNTAVKQLSSLAIVAARDTEALNRLSASCKEEYFLGFLGCALAVGAVNGWVHLSKQGERLVKECLENALAASQSDVGS